MTTTSAPTSRDGATASPAVHLSTPILETIVSHPVPALRSASSAETGRGVPAPAATPTTREPGIYFGLSEAEYHADPSLGSTDLKRLLRSPTDYWWGSWMNPKREPEASDTPAKKQGRALHKLVLEGRAAFHKAYTPEPQPKDWPGALRTMDDLKAVLREAGEKLAGSKEELVKRVRAIAPEAIVWDEVVATFMAAAERDGLQILKPDVFEEVEVAGHMVAMNPHLANAFKDGVPEVSVFWRDEDGLALKCRFDYLKPRTIPDLKKCENRGEQPFEEACLGALRSYAYDMQVAHYLESGYPAFLELARAGRVFGDCPLPQGFARRMAAPADMTMTLVFHQTSGAPVTHGLEIETGSEVLAWARREVSLAKARYHACMARFGTDMWVSETPIRRISVQELPYRYRVAAELEAA